MRVLFFITDLGAGGAERVAAGLCNRWSRDGNHVALVTVAALDADAYAVDGGVKRLSLAARGSGSASGLRGNLARIRALRSMIREHRAQVVVAFMARASILAILASRGLGCRVVVSERVYGPPFPIPRVWSILRRLLYRYADAVVVQTAAAGRWISEEVGARRVVIIPNGVSWPLPSTGPHMEPDAVIGRDCKLVLAVGRLDHQKGFDLLIDAFSAVACSHPEWALVIVGEGSQRALLESRIVQRACPRVFLPGRVGNLTDWYERAEIFVLSSRFEGFPNALLEAMAAGCAVVSSDCPTGPAEIIRPGKDGLLVPSEHATALAEALRTLMIAPDLRSRLSELAKRVVERFDAAEIAQRWGRLLR